MPKLKDDSDERGMLVNWIEFLKNPESDKVRKLEMSVEEIREAKDELIKISNDSEQRERYEIRAKILKDKNSALNKAKRDGMKAGMKAGIKQGEEKGKKEAKLDIAREMIANGLEVEMIAKLTGLSESEIEALK
ncbi:MAG: Rpn family recombination-promoting nuclease/putative transposase [Sarcina sp.]